MKIQGPLKLRQIENTLKTEDQKANPRVLIPLGHKKRPYFVRPYVQRGRDSNPRYSYPYTTFPG